jgi:GNAT superfamily N-acetyltransferase
MTEKVTIAPFDGDQAAMREVADFYLEVQRDVEAAGQRTFDDILDTWQELKQLDTIYVRPGNFWVAHADTTQLVGCVGLRSLGEDNGLVGRFGVDAARRKQGIGTRLIRGLLNWASDNNFRELELDTNIKQDGLPLYERVGFVDTGEHPEDGIDGDIIMRLRM